MSNYFLLSIQLPDTIYSNSRVCPAQISLEGEGAEGSSARGIFLAGATAESGGQVPPVTGDSG